MNINNKEELFQKARESLLWRNAIKQGYFSTQMFQKIQIKSYKNAYWFYEDFMFPIANESIYEKFKEFEFYKWLIEPVQSLQDIRKQFSKQISIYILLQQLKPKSYYKRYKEYCKGISVYGAILLNKTLDKVLLVMNQQKTVYSFPKGKVNQGEDAKDCAIREVWEEVGYDITQQIQQNDYIEMKSEKQGQIKKFFIIMNVEENFEFKTNTRNEIGEIKWVNINQIMDKNNRGTYSPLFPFMEGVYQYISYYQKKTSSPRPSFGFLKDEVQNKLENLSLSDFRISENHTLTSLSQKNVKYPEDTQQTINEKHKDKELQQTERVKELEAEMEAQANITIQILREKLSQKSIIQRPFEKFEIIN